MPLRVLGAGGGTSFDITQAVLYAARLPNSSGSLPAQRADIINLSLGGSGSPQAEQAVYNQARAEVDTLLAAGRLTIDIGAAGRDNSFGHGLIDALKAVQAAQDMGGSAPAVLVSGTSAFNFTPSSSSDTFIVAIGGGGALSVASV